MEQRTFAMQMAYNVLLLFMTFTCFMHQIRGDEVKRATIQLPNDRPPCLYKNQRIKIENFDKLVPPNCELWSVESNILKLVGSTLRAKHKYCPQAHWPVKEPIFAQILLECGPEYQKSTQTWQLHFKHRRLTANHRRARRSLAYSNSNLIRFNQPAYVVNVTEEQPRGELVLAVHATHNDHLPLYYTMVADGDLKSAQMLNIDRLSGEIRTTQKLDREVMPQHVLRVTATESGNPTHSATVLVTVNVADVQDHAPVFDKSTYTETIPEDKPIHTTVLHVYASDSDAGDNGQVRYRIQDPTLAPEFRLDPVTGQIQIARALDREHRETYRFKVVATDLGDPPLEGTSIVVIEVSDVNDNYPQFSQSRYRVTVPENVTIPHKLIAVSAIDADAGDNGRVRYSIVGGGDAFTVDYETGEIQLIRALNFKAAPIHEVIVRAQDSGTPGLSNTTVLEVQVEDVNDHAPTFTTEKIQQIIEENVPKGTKVARAQAYDAADIGDNARVQYFIEPMVQEQDLPFEIHTESGWIVTTRTLDREQSSEHKFNVIAQDMGTPPLATKLSVVIAISDVNDNSPAFDQKFYNVTVPESLTVGSKIATIRARDPDESSTVEYTLIGGNQQNQFSLIPMGDHALIALNKPLDYIQTPEYTLTVKATDNGGLEDTASVQIYILDENSAPRFPNTPFTVNISESTPIGSTVAVLTAVDADSGGNARLSYSMSGGESTFAIGESNGVVELRGKLDREKQATYNLKISASDHGDPPLSAHTEIEVIVDDVNDNAPQFLKQNYSVALSEDVNKGTSFLRLSARDPDSGENARLVYSVWCPHFDGLTRASDRVVSALTYNFSIEPESNPNSTFLIDPTSGTIRVDELLDREQIAQYKLRVTVSDHGVPQHNSTTTVTIDVLDVNDNPPGFADSTLHVHVPENSPIGTVVDQIIAVDPDQGSNAEIRYTISGGHDMQLFELVEPSSGTGNGTTSKKGRLLVTRSELDFELKNKYQLQVQASSGDLSSIVYIVVHVTDENDNRPILEDFYIVITSEPHRPPSSPFARVPAYDPDLNATLIYYLEPNDLLFVDQTSGELSLTAHLNTNRQLEDSYKICVSDGPNMVCARCTLLFIPIEHAMLQQSVTLRLADITKDELLTPLRYGRLRDAIATLGPFAQKDVLLFSVQDDPHNQDVVNVSFSIRQSQADGYVNAETVRELVHLNRAVLAAIAGVNVLRFADNFCVREPCVNYEVCHNSLKYAQVSSDWFLTDNFLFRPVDPIGTFTCECPSGYTSSSSATRCNLEINLCYSSPCRANGTCTPKENGYVCTCPPDRTGPNCEFPLANNFCVPNICSGGAQCDARHGVMECHYCPFAAQDTNAFCQLQTRSFTMGSYLTLPTMKSRSRFQMQLSIATPHPNALLLYNGRYELGHDFISLRLVNGVPEFSFSVGETGKVTSLTLAQTLTNRVDDGKWHTINVVYDEQSVILSIDDCDLRLALDFVEEFDYKRCAARVTNKQEKRCRDGSVSCYRFLDLTGPMYLGGVPASKLASQQQGETHFYDGCIKRLIIDQKLIDLSDQAIISNFGSEIGCRRRPQVCGAHLTSPCKNGARCSEQWLGYRCECPPGYDGKNCDRDSGFIKSFPSDRSYVSWHVPDKQPLNFSVGLPFRTRQPNTQLLVAEFKGKRFVKILIVNEYIQVSVSEQTFVTKFPPVSDARWHDVNVVIDGRKVHVIVDHVYVEHFLLEDDIIYSSVSGLYVGAYNGTHARPYLGCIKDVYFGTNRQYLRVRSHYRTDRGDCMPSNKCVTQPDMCPTQSTCVQHWDTVQCICRPGYVGSQCQDVCSYPVCANGGTCAHSSTTDYYCVCPTGFTGQHCETSVSPSNDQCADGWWGAPVCGPCQCDLGNGESNVCDKHTGQCRCKAKHYRHPDATRCQPCDCYYPAGSSSQQCHPESGQCACRGDVIGQKCDRCPDDRMEIDAVTGLCRAHAGHCPERYERELLWPATKYGRTTTMSCPHGTRGLVKRTCSHKTHNWLPPLMHNCTSIAFESLADTLKRLDDNLVHLDSSVSRRIASSLRFATSVDSGAHSGSNLVRTHDDTLSIASDRLYGKDVYIGYRLVMSLLRYQLSGGNRTRTAVAHVNDKQFTKDLIASAARLFSPQTREWWQHMRRNDADPLMHLTHLVDNYGAMLAASHTTGYLRPFVVSDENMIFAVDDIKDRKNQLPKFDQFLLPEQINRIVRKTSIEIKNYNGAVFYSIMPTLPALVNEIPCESKCLSSPVVAFAQSGSEPDVPVRLTLPLYETHNHTDPKCVWWNTESQSWSRDGCALTFVNRTHVICECTHQSIFAVLMSPSVLDERVMQWYIRILCCVASLLILFVGALRLWCIRHHQGGQWSSRQRIQLAIVLTFALNVLAFLFVIEAKYRMIWCSIVSATLHVSSISTVAWFFIHILHLYRSITDWNSPNQVQSTPTVAASILVAIGLPLILGIVTACMNRSNGYNDFCWLSLSDPYAWTMIIPVLLFTLLSTYIAITCYLVSLNKQWDVFLAKLRLRRVLFGYTLAHLICLCYFVAAWTSMNITGLFQYQDYVVLGLMIGAAAVIVLWLAVLDKQTHMEQARAVSLWMSASVTQQKQQISISEDHPRATQPLRSIESPCLDEHLAPRAEEEDDQTPPPMDGDINESYRPFLSQPHQRGGTAPPNANNYAQHCARLHAVVHSPDEPAHHHTHETSYAAQQHQQVVYQNINPTQQQQPVYKSFIKPDLIPSWDDRVQGYGHAPPLDSPDTQLSGAGSTSYAPSSGYHSGMSSASGQGMYSTPKQMSKTSSHTLLDSQTAHILSPIQKILFTAHEEMNQQQQQQHHNQFTTLPEKSQLLLQQNHVVEETVTLLTPTPGGSRSGSRQNLHANNGKMTPVNGHANGTLLRTFGTNKQQQQNGYATTSLDYRHRNGKYTPVATVGPNTPRRHGAETPM